MAMCIGQISPLALTKQGEQLEAEVQAAEEEILVLVSHFTFLGFFYIDKVSRNERIEDSRWNN